MIDRHWIVTLHQNWDNHLGESVVYDEKIVNRLSGQGWQVKGPFVLEQSGPGEGPPAFHVPPTTLERAD
jgi:hypothetical protein